MSPGHVPPSKKKIVSFALPLLITSAIFLFFFRGASVAQVRQAFAALSLRALLLYALFSLAGALLRCLRFSLLLSRRVRPLPLFLITLVYNFAVDLLPARTAALGFYAYFTHRRGVEWEEGASSFVAAVLYDALSVGILLAPALFLLGGRGLDLLSLGIALGGIMAISLAFLIWAPALLDRLGRWLRGRPRAAAVVRRVQAYFLRHRRASERLLLLGISFLIKLVKYLSIYLLLRDLVPGMPPLSSFFIFSFGVAAAEVSSMLPLQGLAGFGTWEAAFAFAVSQLHLEVAQPFVIALVVHLTTQVWEYSIGLLAFLVLSLSSKGRGAPSASR